MRESNPNFVHSLAKGLDILSAFADGDMLGNQQLVERTGLPKATVSRFTSTLVALGYLRVDAHTHKLLMGSRLAGMVAGAQRKIGLQRIARPLLEKISEDTGLSTLIGSRDRLGLVILDAIRPPAEAHRLVTNADAGTVFPIADTSIGLAYIVAAPVAEQAGILNKLAQRFPDEWPALRQRIERVHTEFKRDGFVTTQQSWGHDVNSVAVAFRPSTSNTLYAFSIAGPATRMPAARMREELGPLLLQFIQDLQNTMARSPTPHLLPKKLYTP